MFEKSAGRQFDFLTQMQLQTVKIVQTDALSQCFVDFLPVLSCFNHTNLNLYHYAGNNPVKYVDQAGKKLELTVDKSEQVENMHKNSGYYRDYLAVTPEMINAKESNFTAKNIDQLNFVSTAKTYLGKSANVFSGTSAQDKLLELDKTEENVYIIAQIPYTYTDKTTGKQAIGKHWVNVNGELVTDKDGVDWFRVGPTSIYDGPSRTVNDNWKQEGSQMFIKVSAIYKIAVIQ